MTTSVDNGSSGIVYILTNPSMPGHIKIGYTGGDSSADVQQRMRELDKTGVPRPFECEYAAIVDDARTVEAALHVAFGDRRIRPTREFFEGVEVHRVQAVLRLMARRDVTPGSTPEVDNHGDEVPVKPPIRSPFTFPMVKIPVGAVLTFKRDESISCTVSDDRHVNYNGAITSLSPLSMKLLGYSTTPAGPDYWLYEDETLNERRRRLETEEMDDN